MNKKTKRWLISISETFGAAFLAILLVQIEPIVNVILEKWVFPTKEMLVSAFVAALVAGVKAVVKSVRESVKPNPLDDGR